MRCLQSSVCTIFPDSFSHSRIHRHLHESQNLGGGGIGGKTPYGGRTPARTPAPGHATPGRMSVRQPGRTPNPYGHQGTPSGSGFGAPPATTFGATPYGGYQTPGGGRPPPPPSGFGQTPAGVPSGMNPQRAAMIQQNGGWSSRVPNHSSWS